MKRIIINIANTAFIMTLVMGLLPTQLVFAERMTSSNYTLESDSVNFAGARSTSSSYTIEDTAGEVGTGNLTAASNSVSAGFQQADPSASPSTSPSPSTSGGSTGGGGSVPIPSGYFSLNVMNFTATAGQTSILLDWMYPLGADIASVRIVRSDKFFPADIDEGEVVFEGDAEQVIDHDVVADKTYYYALFAKNSNGQFSSGVLAQARIISPGGVKIPEDPFETVTMVQNVHPAIAGLTLADFDFIQDGRKIAHAGNRVVIDAKKNLTIQLDYKKVPEILKTIAISLAHPDDPKKIFTFILRANDEKTVYEATIASLGTSGAYQLNAIVLDYGNQGLKRITGEIRALALDSAMGAFYQFTNNPFLLILALLLLVIAILLAVYLVSRNKRKGAVATGVTVAALILYICMSVFVAHAAINKEINYQGKLFTSGGTAVSDGTYQITFKLYTAASGGTAIWTETLSGANEVQVTNGLFSVLLGQVTSLSSIDFNQTLYLGVTIESDSEMSPRKKLGAVPAAFVADTLDGIDSTQFLRIDASGFADGCLRTTSNVVSSTSCGGGSGGGSWSTTTSQVSGRDINYSNNTTDIVAIGGTATTSAKYWFDPNTLTAFLSGNVGIGTTSPYAALSVVGASGVVANRFTATGTVASVLPYASSTALTAENLFVGSLSGVLFGTSGAVSAIATSSLGLLTTNVAEGSNLYYTDARVNSYIAASTTIPKTYTNNIFTGQNIFLSSTTLQNFTAINATTTNATSTTLYSGVLSTGTLCLTSDCRTSWPTFTQINDFIKDSNYGALALTASTTIPLWVKDQFFASSSAVIAGNVRASNFTATSSVASVLPYASTTALSATTICLTSDCRTSWPTGSGFPFVTATNYGVTTNSTTSPIWFQDQIFGSSSAIIAGSVTANNFIATGTARSVFPYASTTALSVTDLFIASLTGPLQAVNGVVSASSTIAAAYGGTGLNSYTQGDLLYATNAATLGKLGIGGNGTCLTSNGSTPSWGSCAVGGGSGGGTWSTTTSQVAGRDVNYSNNSSDIVAVGGTSTTSAKYWFDPNVQVASLAGAVTVGGSLTIGSLNGPLQAVNGTVSATSTLSVAYGGTGLSTAPSFGNILVGNNSGGYTLTATSSLGLITTNVAEGSNLYYTDARVNSYIAASTTIPKTYVGNTFTNSNTFTGSTTVATLLATSSTTLQNFTALNATTTNATTTTLFATTASSTNLFATIAQFGTASFGKINNLTTNGFIKTINGDGTLSVDTSSYLLANSTDWQQQTNYGVQTLTASTTIPLWVKDQFFASSSAVIAGNVRASNFTATSSVASIFPYASTTGLSSTQGAAFATSGGTVGIGTTTPWATFAINPIAGQAANRFVVGSSTATSFLINNTGNVGIGTTSPAALLTNSGTTLLSGRTAIGPNSAVNGSLAGQTTNSTLSVKELFTTFLTYTFGVNTDITLQASSVPSGTFGVGSITTLRTAGIQNYTGGSVGIASYAQHEGSGTVSALRGLLSTASNQGSGTTTTSYGLATVITNANGTTSTAYGVHTAATLVAGLLNEYSGVYISRPTVAGGTFTNNFGLYIENQAARASNLNYNIYSLGTSSINYFNGLVGVGTSTPYERLSVDGRAVVTDNVLSSYFTATSSRASTFPYASTTALSATTICLTSDCRTSWPTGIQADWEKQTNYGTLALTPTTTIPVWFKDQILASSSAVIAGQLTTNNVVATGSAVSSFAGNVGIGTTTPNNPLSIYNTSKAAIEFSGASGSTYKWTIGQDVANGGRFTIASSSALGTLDRFVIDGAGNVGIGTSSPGTVFSINSVANFTAATSTFASTGGINLTAGCFAVRGNCISLGGSGTVESGSTGQFAVYTVNGTTVTGGSALRFEGANIGIGTTSPYAALSVVGATGVVADIFTATSTTATSTFAGGLNVGNGSLMYDFSSGVTTIDNLAVGALSFDTNAGFVSWVDLPVTSAAAAGTIEGYSAQIDSNYLLTLYGESDGAGGVRSLGVSVGSSTPYAKLSVWGGGTGAGKAFEIANNASSTLFHVLDNGTGYFANNFGIGTTTPGAQLGVRGDIIANAIIGSYFTATSTTATSTFANHISIGAGKEFRVDGTGILTRNSNASVLLGRLDGNSRGSNALDLQSLRNAVTQVAAGADSVAVGTYNRAGGADSMAFGTRNSVSIAEGLAYGASNTVTGSTFSSAFGYNNIASSTASLAFGVSNQVGENSSGSWASAFGLGNWVDGIEAQGFGTNNTVNGTASGAYGYLNTIAANGTYVFGANITNNIAGAVQIGVSDASKLTLLSSGNLGVGTTTPGQKLSVAGDVLGHNIIGSRFHATSTTASVFPYASTTALSTTNLFATQLSNLTSNGFVKTINGDGTLSVDTSSYLLANSTDWQKQTNYGVQTLTSSSTIPVWVKDQFFASSSAIFAGNVTANTFIATGTTASVLPYASTTAVSASGNFFAANGLFSAPAYTFTSNKGAGMYWDGSNLGLSAGSTFTLALSSTQTITNPAGSASAPAFAQANDVDTGIYWPTANVFAISTNATERVRVGNSGTVGISTSSSPWMLQVASTSANSNATFRPQLALTDMNGATDQKHWTLGSLGGNFYLGAATDSYATSSIAALTILPNQNAGFGTSSPAFNLGVRGNIGANNLYVSNVFATSTTASVFPYASTTALSSGNAWFTGNIGVGTTTPTQRISSVDNISWGANNEGLLTWAAGSASLRATQGRDLRLQSNNGSSEITLKSGGNVGIGTTTPETKLHVEGTGTNTTLGQLDTNLRLGTNTVTADAGNEISFRGINTASPDVATYAAISAPVISNGPSGAQGYLSFSTKASAAATSLTEHIRLNHNGYLGLGTTTDLLAKLSVFGTNSTTGSGLIVNEAVSTGCPIGSGSTGYFGYLCANTGGNSNLGFRIHMGETIAGRRALDISNATGIFASFDGNGRLGVGSTTPNAKTTIQSDGTTTGLGLDVTNSNGTSIFRVIDSGVVAINTESCTGLAACIGRRGGGGQLDISINNTITTTLGSDVDFYVTPNSGRSGGFTFNTMPSGGAGNRLAMVITNAGNVGIGTSSPYQKLSVAGGNVHVGGVIISTSTTASNIFPYASTTALTADTLCISTDCRTAWPAAGGGAFPFTTETNYGITTNSTTSPLWFRDQVFASSSIIAAGSVRASSLHATTTTATSTIAGSMIIGATTPIAAAARLEINAGALPFGAYLYGNSGSGISTTLEVVNNSSAATSLGISSNAPIGIYTQASVANGVGIQVAGPGNESSGYAIYSESGKNYFEGNIGIGSSSPWANLAVNPVAGFAANQFVVGSSTATSFLINNSGNVGIGTTSPGSIFGIQGVANFTTGTSTFVGTGGGINLTSGCFAIRGACMSGGGGAGVSTYLALTDTPSSFTAKAIPFTNTGATALLHDSIFVYDGTNMGIGTSSPYAKLSVVGPVVAAYFHATSTTATSTFAGGLEIGSGVGDSIFQFGGDATAWSLSYLTSDNSFRIASSTDGITDTLLSLTKEANAGIGTTTPWRKLSVNGTLGLSGSLTSGSTGNYLCINNTTYEVTTGTTCSASSERFKENVNALTYGLDTVDALRPVSFTYKPSADPDPRLRLGFMAEEVRELIPELVNLDKDGLPESVDYAKLTPVLVKAIQELNEKVNAFASTTAPTATTTIEALENSTTFIEKIATKVAEMLQATGGWIADRISAKYALFDEVQANKISAASITATSSLTVGSQQKPTGVTIFDKANGNPYCLNLVNGALIPSQGACENQPIFDFPTPAPYIPDNAPPPPPATTTPDNPNPSPTPTPQATTTPETSPTPTPTPEASPTPTPTPEVTPTPSPEATPTPTASPTPEVTPTPTPTPEQTPAPTAPAPTPAEPAPVTETATAPTEPTT